VKPALAPEAAREEGEPEAASEEVGHEHACEDAQSVHEPVEGSERLCDAPRISG